MPCTVLAFVCCDVHLSLTHLVLDEAVKCQSLFLLIDSSTKRSGAITAIDLYELITNTVSFLICLRPLLVSKV